jgi:hypothetical protein
MHAVVRGQWCWLGGVWSLHSSEKMALNIFRHGEIQHHLLQQTMIADINAEM